MILNRDIYRAAKLLIDQHGQDARIRAAERADTLSPERKRGIAREYAQLENRDSSVMMSSVMPSLKYCCSGSLPVLVKGSTAIRRFGGVPVGFGGRRRRLLSGKAEPGWDFYRGTFRYSKIAWMSLGSRAPYWWPRRHKVARWSPVKR